MSPHRYSLGQLIRRRRAAQGLSQRALARAAEVDNSMILRLERGDVERPDPALLERLARVLGSDLADFYVPAGYPLTYSTPEPAVYFRRRFGYELTEEEQAQLDQVFDELRARKELRTKGGNNDEYIGDTTTSGNGPVPGLGAG